MKTIIYMNISNCELTADAIEQHLKKKMSDTDLNKTIEQLEKWYFTTQNNESFLISECSKLVKKPLKDFEIEDLRIMIGQSIGLKYLIPIAIKVLDHNILAEGDFYEGDLLKSVLTSENTFWKNNKKDWKEIFEIFIKNQDIIYENELNWQIKNELFLAFENFKKINQFQEKII
jgi:hypothetical protein